MKYLAMCNGAMPDFVVFGWKNHSDTEPKGAPTDHFVIHETTSNKPMSYIKLSNELLVGAYDCR
jgi:hypothetical protein